MSMVSFLGFQNRIYHHDVYVHLVNPTTLGGAGNNPKTAVHEYLKTHPEFEIDKGIQHQLLITVAPDGYLGRVG